MPPVEPVVESRNNIKIEDFEIVNGDTLASPAFTENGKLRQFDMIVANPPYSVSQ